MKKVLFLGFSPIQLELARKLVAFRKLDIAIEILPEQRSSVLVDAYVVNGDDPSVTSRLAIYTRVNPQPVLAVGSRAMLGATSYAAGPFKPTTVDQLAQLLKGGAGSTPSGERPADAPGSNVVSFPGPARIAAPDVLVVDDSDVVRRTMQRKIREYGHMVDLASSGDDAMAMLLNNSYRLVFLDIMMPGVDGFEVCKRITRSREYKSSAVYMLTSRDGMFDKVRGAMAGCDGYLVKPLESRKLREVLDLYFERPSFIGDSNMFGSQGADAELSAEERAVVEGTPPPAEAVPDMLTEPPSADFKPTFEPTMPASLVDLNAIRKS